MAAAIKRNAPALAQAQATYKENVVVVNTFVNGVLTSKLPNLTNRPPDWEEFLTAYVRSGSDALEWVNEVMARLLEVPKDVASYDETVSALLEDARNQTQILVAEPGNQAAHLVLNQDLKAIASQLTMVIRFVEASITAVNDFGDRLPELATHLQVIATKSANDAKADKQKIEQLNADIESLRRDIGVLTAELIGLGLAEGVALTLGTVATIAAWPVGAAVWLLMGPVVAVATTYIAIDARKIVADKEKIAADQREITGLTEDVAALQVLTSHYAAMAAQTTEIEAGLVAILAAWRQLEERATMAIAEIQEAIDGAGSDAFEAVLADLEQAVVEWRTVSAEAGSLVVDLQVNDAELEFGMSPAELQAALAGGQTLGIIEYFNQVGASVAPA
ncbi:MAG TPA: hypothetical protein VFX85_03680 [Solirubrobacterales bacterium]|nr:hypothetical protein [Solirubrobacterales bacterium]